MYHLRLELIVMPYHPLIRTGHEFVALVFSLTILNCASCLREYFHWLIDRILYFSNCQFILYYALAFVK